jgi:hypothetical protein
MKAKIVVALAVCLLFGMSAVSTFAQGAPPLNFAPVVQYTAQLGTGGEMTVFNGAMYMAFMANDSSYTLYIKKSTDGTWTVPSNHYPSIIMMASTGPAIAAFNGRLYVAYTGSDGYVYLISSADAVNFSSPIHVYYYNPSLGGTMAMANAQPSMAVNDNLLWIGFERNAQNTSTFAELAGTDGNQNWYNGGDCGGPNGEEPQTGAAIGLASFNGALYYAFQSQGEWSHHLVVCANHASTVYSSIEVGSGISATAYNGSLYLAFKDITGDNHLHISGTSNGTTFTDTTYSGIDTNGRQQIVPGTTVFNNTYYLNFVQNDTGHYLEATHSE